MTATATILSGGNPIGAEFALMSVDVQTRINRIPRARIRFVAGPSALEAFALSDDSKFAVGEEFEIKLRREGEDDATVFKGVLVRQSVQFGREGETLEVELKDKAHSLTVARRSNVFRNSTDDQAIQDICDNAGLTADTGSATQPEHEELVQYQVSDWDFIVARADVHGLAVAVEDATVALKPLKIDGSPKMTFQYGRTPAYDVDLQVDGSGQPEGVEAISWDGEARAVSAPTAGEEPGASPGGTSGSDAAGALSAPPMTLVHAGAVLEDERAAWASGRLARRRLSVLRGRLSIPGDGSFKLMDVVELEGVGARFDGQALITGVRHRVDARGWQTDLEIGVDPEAYTETTNVTGASASGLIPGAGGLQLGTVESLEDESGELRVQVKLAALSGGDDDIVFARLAQADAGSGHGMIFRPEVGDEVVVGFVNQDPRFPIVLGALHSSGQAPSDDWMPSEDNERRGILTRSGTQLTFVDGDNASVTIETPSGNQLVVDDEAEGITIKDQNDNKIVMNADGITIESAADLNIKASGSIKITGSEVDIE